MSASSQGALTGCEKCKSTPIAPVEQAVSLALTDRHCSNATLISNGKTLAVGKPCMSINPEVTGGYLEALRTQQGRTIIENQERILVQNDNPKSAQATRTTLIAKRLMAVEDLKPGTIEMMYNPRMISKVAKAIKEGGIKKPLFIREGTFLSKSILTYGFAMLRILPSSLLISGSEPPKFDCWSGSGRFRGRKTPFELKDFRSGGLEKVTCLIHISPILEEIRDLLESHEH